MADRRRRRAELAAVEPRDEGEDARSSHGVPDIHVEVAVGTMLAYRVATMQARGLVPNHEASAAKVFGSEMSQRIALTGMHLLGTAGQLRKGSRGLRLDLASGYMGAVGSTIAAG